MADNLTIEVVFVLIGIAGFIFGLTKNEENKKNKKTRNNLSINE